jgi:hypothetical protein
MALNVYYDKDCNIDLIKSKKSCNDRFRFSRTRTR